MIAHAPHEGIGDTPDPFHLEQCAQELLASGAISLTTFREWVRECHEALRAAAAAELVKPKDQSLKN